MNKLVSLLNKLWKDMKPQIDFWSITHFIGPVIIVISLKILGIDNDLSVLTGIVCSYSWEFFDYCCSEKNISKFFDKRGASWIDYLLGIIGIYILGILFNFDFNLNMVIISTILFIFVIYMYNYKNWS